MSEKVLRVSVADLTTLRVKCRNDSCGAVTEFEIDKPLNVRACGACGQSYFAPNHLTPIADLVAALRSITSLGQATVEFSIVEEAVA